MKIKTENYIYGYGEKMELPTECDHRKEIPYHTYEHHYCYWWGRNGIMPRGSPPKCEELCITDRCPLKDFINPHIEW